MPEPTTIEELKLPRNSTHRRFWSKVAIGDWGQCWEWRSYRNPRGYGRYRQTDGKYVYAHRFARQACLGDVIKDLCVCHRCDNPSCVNPWHTFIGTRADNVADMINKGRKSPVPGLRGDRHPQAKLNWDQVAEIRATPVSRKNARLLAVAYGVSRCAIYCVWNGETWTKK